MKRLPWFLTLGFVAVACLWSGLAMAKQPLNVWIKLPPQIPSNGIVSGTTNLPNGTIITISLAGPYASQFNHDNQAYAAIVAISHGAFGPVDVVSNGVTPPPGRYTFQVVMRDWSMQPASVVAIIGKNGDNLSGPLVKDEYGSRNVDTEIPVEVR